MADFDELRRQPAAMREVLSYIDVRIEKHVNRLTNLLLTERDSDTLRGRIVELKNLRNMVQATGEADE